MHCRALALALLVACNAPTDHAPRGWLGPAAELGEGVTQRPIPEEPELLGAAMTEALPAVARFRALHAGAWDIEMDPILGTARSLAGAGVAGEPADATALVAAHVDLFGLRAPAPAGTVTSTDGTVAVVTFLQHHRGIPVVDAHLSVTYVHGRAVLLQGTTYRIPDSLDVAPRVTLVDAIAAADDRLAVASPQDRADGRLVVLPGPGPSFKLAWEVTAWRGPRRAIAYVDARTDALVAAYDANSYEYRGTATNRVDERTVGDAILTLPASDLRITTARGTAFSDPGGGFSFSGLSAGPMMVTADLRGTYVDVKNVSGANARFTGILWPDRANGLAWNEARSLPEERDVFRGVNVTNRYVATVLADVPWMGRPVPANVNLRATCNAFWNGTSINFYREGGACNNTGRIFDVVAHEWGHGLDANLPGGIQDGALSEFIGDLLGFLQTASPLVGPGFLKNGGAVRDLEDPAYRCYDPKKREVHDAGQLLGAVAWDIYKDLKAAGVDGDRIKRLFVLPIAIAESRAQWYRAMLAADDVDGNLANGTPNECLIYRQFVAHSCKGTRWPGIPDRAPAGCSTVR